MEHDPADPQQRLEREIAILRQRLESAEEMHRAIAGGQLDGFVVGMTDEDRRIALLDIALPHYGQIVQRMQQGAITVSRSGEILYANQRFAGMLGESLADLFVASLQQHAAKGDRERLEAFLAAGTPDSTRELTLRRRDGAPMRARLTLVSRSDGQVSLLVTDLSTHERLEEAEGALQALRNGEIDGVVVGGEEIMLLGNAYQAYKAIADRMQQGAVTVSSQGDVLYANARFAAMVGEPAEALLGRHIESWFAPADRNAVRDIIAHCAAGTGQAELHIATRRHSTLPVLVSACAADASGAVTMVVTDVTEQHRHREIEEEGRRKDEFLAVLAHELRNPLAPIRNAVQILQRAPELPPTARQAAEIIGRQCATLTRLLEDLLDINRLNQGKITLKKTSLDLRTVIDSAVEAAHSYLDDRGHVLQVQMPDEVACVDGDPVRLTQIVVNLLSNAAKYTPTGGAVRVALHIERAGTPRVVLRVSDTGIGIAAESLRKIFEPYTQVGDSKEAVHSGLGLGLTVARRLVELHGGSITAQSGGAGQGSEFTVELPLAEGRPVAASAVAADVPSTIRTSGMRILVADDNADSVQSLAMLLALSGHETRTAKDGAEALAVADAFQPHIAFLDIGMPKLDGYATARELRARPWARDLALYALTGWGQPEDRRRARDAGFDAHLVKPLDPGKLEQIIAAKKGEPRA